ncbi:MAG: valine--tRNA ligase [Actinomycetota bacterium]
MSDLPKAYVPADAEAAVTARWDAAGASHVVAPDEAGQPTYSIVIPPPNVTGALHLGHGLNNTLQDVLVRYHRMKGLPTLWMPGTDHAGIATQTVVEKRLLAQGINRLEIGREAFIAKTQEWKDEYEATILGQLKQIGASCDWDRVRFTMDDMCATAVRHAFFEFFKDGLVYRGKRLVNWDPVTQTALADDEVEMEEVEGHMWYLRYPLEDGSGHVTVATTRPETMLGDTAVAVNPEDPAAESVVGKYVVLPIVGRRIPIVADDYVVMADPDSSDSKAQYASGFLKVTPAHDPNDWDIGLRHELPVINVMGPDASISSEHGWDDISDDARAFVGMSREDARSAIVEWFDASGLLEEVREYSHSVGHSYRSHVPIEPWLSDQWYVAVTDDRLRGEALRAQPEDQVPELPDGIGDRSTERAGDAGMRFFPERYARTYHAWHANIRDWCISRQLWWGHQIPVWMRVIEEADAPPEVREALERVGVNEPTAVTSDWIGKGAAHVARRVTSTEVEEAICIPPDATLRRTDGALSETDLVAAVEAAGYERDPDVLDTWFSSGLWPLSTMGWPFPKDFPETVGLLDAFNPTSVLITGRDIITLWVSRMVMFNRYFMDGQLPFEHVMINSMIQDGHGQRMSKSLGNGVDPLDIVDSHGADAMRYGMVHMSTDTQDVRMPVDLICPHTGEAFSPEMITTPAGLRVAAPVQSCPTDPSKKMVSAYGAASGQVEPTDEMPLARNTSSKFDLGRNFANKVWNATRFALSRLDGTDNAGRTVDLAAEDSTVTFADRWILARLHETVAAAETAIEGYHFNELATTLYDFIWRDVCDRYLEAIKATIDDNADQQVVLGVVLDSVLRLLHPVCPFVTETLWPHVAEVRGGDVVGVDAPADELLATAVWPSVGNAVAAPGIVGQFERADALVAAVRNVRSEQQVKPRRQITMHVPESWLDFFAAADGYVESLAGIATVTPDAAPAGASPLVFEGEQLHLSDMVDAADAGAEAVRLTKKVDELRGQIGGLEGRLANKGYVDNAPANLVQETRDQLAAAQADLEATEAALAAL